MKRVTITYATHLDALIDVASMMGGYENKYGVESEYFLAKYQNGDMPCENDFMDWAVACGDFAYLRNEVSERFGTRARKPRKPRIRRKRKG